MLAELEPARRSTARRCAPTSATARCGWSKRVLTRRLGARAREGALRSGAAHLQPALRRRRRAGEPAVSLVSSKGSNVSRAQAFPWGASPTSRSCSRCRCWSRPGSRHYFDIIVSGDMLPKKKARPDARHLRAAGSSARRPEHVVMIGDSGNDCAGRACRRLPRPLRELRLQPGRRCRDRSASML